MQILSMAKKSETIKIGGLEIKDHRTVSFTSALLIGIVCFTVGVLAYYVFMILPTKPGCINVFVKTVRGDPIPNAKVQVYATIVEDPSGQELITEYTGPGGKATICGVFQANSEYGLRIIDEAGTELYWGAFMTNERSTAEVPIRVRS